MGDTTADPVNPTTDPTTDPTNPNGNTGASGSGADKVDPQVIDAVTITTMETIPMAASIALANLYQHQTNTARRLDSLNEAFNAKMLKRFCSQDPVEAISTSKLLKGEADSSIGSLLAQLSASQEAAKIAQSTPGSLDVEIAKLGAALSSLQSLLGGLTAILQVSMKNDVQPKMSFQKKAAPAPQPIPAPAPQPAPTETPAMPSSIEIGDDRLKFPKVTVRFNGG